MRRSESPAGSGGRSFLLLSAANGFLAVALGAFGAHGLEGRLGGLQDGAERLGWWQTAAHYHLVHAVALAVVSLVVAGTGARAGAARFGGVAFLLGMLLFSGSLYVMSLTGARALGMVTPIGGACFLAGWAALVLAARHWGN